jgi:hypothetical protein
MKKYDLKQFRKCNHQGEEEGKRKEWLLYAHTHTHTHQSILGAVGHIILTSANQLIVMGLKKWSLSNPGFEPERPFDHWPNALINCANCRPTKEEEEEKDEEYI